MENAVGSHMQTVKVTANHLYLNRIGTVRIFYLAEEHLCIAEVVGILLCIVVEHALCLGIAVGVDDELCEVSAPELWHEGSVETG